MLISAQSTDRESYNTVRTNFEVPWKCQYVKYYVSSMNTMGNILMMTKDDFIEIELPDEQDEDKKIKILKFRDYFIGREGKDLATTFNIYTKFYIEWDYTYLYKVFTMKFLNKTIIRNMSHRMKLITGLFNEKLPLQYTKDLSYYFKTPPMYTQSKFYLVSLQGNPMYANIGEQQHTPSIIGNIDTFVVDGKPIIYNFEKEGKPLKIKTYTNSLKNLEISLVDFQFQPVILKSPLNLCIKIKPAKDADVKDILTK